MVTEHETAKAIKQLEVIYGPQKSRDDLVRAWRYALEELTPEELARAVRDYVRSEGRFFPKPGHLRALALGERSRGYGGQGDSEPRDWNALQDGPCPVCGAVLQLAVDPLARVTIWDHQKRYLRRRTKDDPEPQKRYTVLHDAGAHHRADVDIVGHSTGGY